MLLHGDVQVRGISPDGTELGVGFFDGPTLPPEVTIEAAAKEFGTTQPNTDPAAGRPTRVRGRVIDEASVRVPAGVQLVLWGSVGRQPAAGGFVG